MRYYSIICYGTTIFYRYLGLPDGVCFTEEFDSLEKRNMFIRYVKGTERVYIEYHRGGGEYDIKYNRYSLVSRDAN